VTPPGSEPIPVEVQPEPVDEPHQGGSDIPPGTVVVSGGDTGPIDEPTSNPISTTGDGPEETPGIGEPVPVPITTGDDPTPVTVDAGPVDEPNPVTVTVTEPGEVPEEAETPTVAVTPVDEPEPVTLTVEPSGSEPVEITVFPTPIGKKDDDDEPQQAPDPESGNDSVPTVAEPPTMGDEPGVDAVSSADPAAEPGEVNINQGDPAVATTDEEQDNEATVAPIDEPGRQEITTVAEGGGGPGVLLPFGDKDSDEDDEKTGQQQQQVAEVDQQEGIDAITSADWSADPDQDSAIASLVAETLWLVDNEKLHGGVEQATADQNPEDAETIPGAPPPIQQQPQRDEGSYAVMEATQRVTGDRNGPRTLELTEVMKDRGAFNSPIDEIKRLEGKGYTFAAILRTAKKWRFDRPVREYVHEVRHLRRLLGGVLLGEETDDLEDTNSALGLGQVGQIALREAMALQHDAGPEAGVILPAASAHDALIAAKVQNERAIADPMAPVAPRPMPSISAVIDEKTGNTVSWKVGGAPAPKTLAPDPTQKDPTAAAEITKSNEGAKVASLESKLSGELAGGKKLDPMVANDHKAAVTDLKSAQMTELVRVQADLARINKQISHADGRERAELIKSREKLLSDTSTLRAGMMAAAGSGGLAALQKITPSESIPKALDTRVTKLSLISRGGAEALEMTYADGAVRVVDKLIASAGNGGDSLASLLPILPPQLQLRAVTQRGQVVGLEANPGGISIPLTALAGQYQTDLPRALLERVAPGQREQVATVIAAQAEQVGVFIDPRKLGLAVPPEAKEPIDGHTETPVVTHAGNPPTS
jgi:hypothetical protein